MKVAAERATKTMGESNPQNLANILWSFATMDIVPPDDMLKSSLERFQELLDVCNPQGLANTLWALASLGYFPGQCIFLVVAVDDILKSHVTGPGKGDILSALRQMICMAALLFQVGMLPGTLLYISTA